MQLLELDFVSQWEDTKLTVNFSTVNETGAMIDCIIVQVGRPERKDTKQFQSLSLKLNHTPAIQYQPNFPRNAVFSTSVRVRPFPSQLTQSEQCESQSIQTRITSP